MLLEETYTLSNDVKIPKIALGTWMIDDDKVANAVIEAVKLGYRHIDTAQAYGNERGARHSQLRLAREDIFLTTKLEADIKNYDDAKAAIKDLSINSHSTIST